MAVQRRRSITAPRRKRVWARELDSGAISAGGITQFNLLSGFYTQLGATVPGLTIGRIRLSAAWETTSTPDPLDSSVLGIRVGGAAVEAVDQDPGNLLDGGAHLDWMFWSKRYPGLEGAGSAATGNAQWDFDIKSQRRLEEIGMTLWLVVSNTSSALLAGTFSYGVSSLVVLP